MNHQFLFLDYEKKVIEGKEFIIINILEFNSKHIFKIYKLFDNTIISILNNFDLYENINDFISFVIKRDGKISLDIKF